MYYFWNGLRYLSPWLKKKLLVVFETAMKQVKNGCILLQKNYIVKAAYFKG